MRPRTHAAAVWMELRRVHELPSRATARIDLKKATNPMQPLPTPFLLHIIISFDIKF
uniref:Uncharacterized protein n=1 Tax=Triticum urartu TaxID=4572 RepID=A0A8R7U760_TRIUA